MTNNNDANADASVTAFLDEQTQYVQSFVSGASVAPAKSGLPSFS
ncbi:MAG: hypothetical protein NVS2B7_37020 [Herpetosiphon sp.]